MKHGRRINKDKAAQELIDWHFLVESGLEMVFRIISADEPSPQEPIKLLEVTTGTIPTGKVEPFVFPPTSECPYQVVIAEVTPEEYRRIRRNAKLLPAGWRLDTAAVTKRRQAA